MQAGSPRDAAGVEQGRADAECSKEEGVETRCSNAFAAVQHFERTHCLILQNMGLPYLQRRADLVGQTVHLVDTLGFQDEVAHDAVLLMDRFMSSTMQVIRPTHLTVPPNPSSRLSTVKILQSCHAMTRVLLLR